MAKLPQLKRIVVEDFPSQKSWIGKLLASLNEFFTEVVAALDHNLTFRDNLLSMVYTLDITNPVSYPLYFKNTMKVKPQALWVGQVTEVNAASPTISSAVYVDWQDAGDGRVKINGTYGLSTTAGKRFLVTLYVMGG
jgi:hypothetical protein